jgi:hypothetical protein
MGLEVLGFGLGLGLGIGGFGLMSLGSGSLGLAVLRHGFFSGLATYSSSTLLRNLYVNRQYSEENNNGPKKSNLKSFDEIFAEELEITANTIRIQNDSDFIPNNKYFNKFEEISQIGRGSYGQVFKVKLKSSSELFAIKKTAIKMKANQ